MVPDISHWDRVQLRSLSGHLWVDSLANVTGAAKLLDVFGHPSPVVFLSYLHPLNFSLFHYCQTLLHDGDKCSCKQSMWGSDKSANRLLVKQEHCDPNSLFVFELHVWCEHDSLVLVCCVMFVALSMLDIMKISICCMSLLITS